RRDLRPRMALGARGRHRGRRNARASSRRWTIESAAPRHRARRGRHPSREGDDARVRSEGHLEPRQPHARRADAVHRRRSREAGERMSRAIDSTSLLVEAAGDTTLAAIEAELSAVGLTLGVRVPETTTVATWIASGTPGAQSMLADPADHVVAGFEATLV